MPITVEVSLYPLRESYIESIDFFISFIRENKEITMEVNSTSTRFSGESEIVFPLLQKATEQTFRKFGKAIVVSKILNGDLLDA